jgi:hypothetical protein
MAGDFIGLRGYGVPFAFTGTACLIAFFGLVLLARKADGPADAGDMKPCSRYRMLARRPALSDRMSAINVRSA